MHVFGNHVCERLHTYLWLFFSSKFKLKQNLDSSGNLHRLSNISLFAILTKYFPLQNQKTAFPAKLLVNGDHSIGKDSNIV